MKYYEVKFTLSPYSNDACDVLAALAGEVGFESFEETETGLTGYVQQTLFDEQALQDTLADFPFEDIAINYAVSEAEDRDWNEQWEQEGFDPIIIADGAIIIHDGRHLPETVSEQAVTIEINAKLAFGTGTHETTRMVCASLQSVLSPLTPLRILDCGTGTGILSICALKLGAREAIGYDIDEWSVDNARHNAVINQVDDRFTSLQGDVSIIKEIDGTFDVVMANINRNILLADMPAMKGKMAAGGRLILSGFYTDDSPLLIEKAQNLGLTLAAQKEENGWACLIFQN